jgi:hypothetical protein
MYPEFECLVFRSPLYMKQNLAHFFICPTFEIYESYYGMHKKFEMEVRHKLLIHRKYKV